MNNEQIQVTLIKDGRTAERSSITTSPVFASEQEKNAWLRTTNETLRADIIEVRYAGQIKRVGRRTTGGGYAWQGAGWGGR